MQATKQPHIQFFDSYETRETALAGAVGHLVPGRLNGPRQFWKEFRQIAGREVPAGIRENITYISADPRDTLAFGSPRQVLAAACLCTAGSSGERFSLRELAAGMQIETLLDQPIRTLSGGESVKLALAKALAFSGTSARLVVASPFSWLSRSNRALFERALDGYRRRQVPVEILALAGEDDLAPARAAEFSGAVAGGAAFSLVFSGARLAIGSPVNAVTDDQLYARIADFHGDLVSPCLLTGENGQGKSLLAKALAGAIATRGTVVARSGHAAGRARLLFQDVVTQTLLRSFEGIVASAGGDRHKRVVALYRQLLRASGNGPGESAGRHDPAGTGIFGRRRTLLEIKTALIAVRLAARPPVLILDEPDWGLSRPAAIALVAAVIDAAHALDVPVLLISHKPWWQMIAGSRLRVAKVPLKAAGCPFEIRLERL